MTVKQHLLDVGLIRMHCCKKASAKKNLSKEIKMGKDALGLESI